MNYCSMDLPLYCKNWNEWVVMSAQLLHIHSNDNVVVAVKGLEAGSSHQVNGLSLELAEDIAGGHKAALMDIAKGEVIIKYGVPIARATRDIKAGQWVHSHNVHSMLEGPLEYEYQPVTVSPLSLESELTSFEGFLREDGRAGIRNEIWVINTVACSTQVSQQLVNLARERFSGAAIDGIYSFEHGQGCSQIGDDLKLTQDFLAGLAKNPNAGGVLVAGLGCEVNNLGVFEPLLNGMDPERLRLLNLQDHEDELEAGLELLGPVDRPGRAG